MRPVLWGLLGFVVCLPLAFVLLIVTAAKYPAMDTFTLKLPAGIQTTVADLILQKAGYGKDSAKGIDRAIKFDPENPDAWTRRCRGNLDGTTSDQATCRKAIALQPTAWNFNGLGAAQDDDGDTKDDLLSDREYLAVGYDRTNQPAKATAMCTKAHTGWKTCHCELTETSVKCSGVPIASTSKK